MKAASSEANGSNERIGGLRRAPRRPRRPRRSVAGLTAASVALMSVVAVFAQGIESAAPAAAAKGPYCSFSAPSHTILQVVLNTTPGEVVNTKCDRLPPNTSFLQVELSLTAAVDPAAATLLTGGNVTSLNGLLSAIAVTPELNALSENISSSDGTGHLNVNYTVPFTQPTDPGSPCPPTTEEFNSGLIGCAVAMINLSTFKPVTAGTFLLHYPGSFLPPAPTAHLSPDPVVTGGTVKASDAPGHTSYWWVATLAALGALLGGGGGAPASFPVSVRVGGKKAINNTVSVTPASYNLPTFTPPAMSGSFTAGRPGRHKKVTIDLTASVLGLGLPNQVITSLEILK